MNNIAVNLICEDALSHAVLRRLLAESGAFSVGVSHTSGGFGWIKKKINSFNQVAKGMPYIILTDLDEEECPPVLLRKWLKGNKHSHLILRVAVKEVEAWLLASRSRFAKFLGVSEKKIPVQVEEIPNPKEFVIQLARKSRKKSVAEDIVPPPGVTARVGPDYNGQLIRFVSREWDIGEARTRSNSLDRAIRALCNFKTVGYRN